MSELPYAASFCEENVWHLCADPRVGRAGRPTPLEERRVLVITNPQRAVATWAQRAGDPVVWDYHVVLWARADEWLAWDLDTTLGLPLPAQDWLDGSFRSGVPETFAPRFRLLAAAEYRAVFSSDRAHMLDQRGRPRAPFPSWPPILRPGGPTLGRLLDLTRREPGLVLDLPGLLALLRADRL